MKKFRCSLLKLIVFVVWLTVLKCCALCLLGYTNLLCKLESILGGFSRHVVASSHFYNTLNMPNTFPVFIPTSPWNKPSSLQDHFHFILTPIQPYSNLLPCIWKGFFRNHLIPFSKLYIFKAEQII